MDTQARAPVRLSTDGVEKTLRTLSRELDRESVHRPPSDGALERWEQRARDLITALEGAGLPGRNRLLRNAARFLDELDDVRQRKARYLARKPSALPFLGVPVDTGSSPVPDGVPRSPLAVGVRAGLEMWAPAASADGEAAGAVELQHPQSSPEPPQRSEATDDAPSTEVARARPAPQRKDAPAQPARPPGDARAQPVRAPTAAANRPAAPARAPADIEGLPDPVSISPARRMSRRMDPIIAVAGRLGRPGSFEEARGIALEWLRRRRFQFDDAAANALNLRTPQGHTATSVSLPERGVWALQAETADREMQGRRWRVEMVLLDVEPTPAVSVTLTAISPAGSPEPATSVPGLVTQLVQRIGLLDASDGSPLDAAGPVRIDDLDTLQNLLAALHSEHRARPALVLSTYRKDGQLKQLLDPVGLAGKLAGLAQVWVLSREMAWPFNEVVGSHAAVAGASVRMFRPGFSVDDAPGRHPLWSPSELSAQDMDLNGLSNTLLREAAYQSLRALEREDAIPPFDRVRELVLQRQIEEARRKAQAASDQGRRDENSASLRQALDSEIELRNLFEEDNANLRKDLERAVAERNQAQDERDTLRGTVLHLQGRVQDLLQELRDAQSDEDPYFPESWDELSEWCERYLGDRVILTPKALRSARNSRFLDIPFAYKALWVLAEHYVPARRNGGEGYREYLEELGLELTPVGRSATDHRSRETYSTDYKGQRVNLDWHVKGSSDRDPRYGFRIYYHWHAGDQCMVVGSLPEHLDNLLS